MRNNPMRFMCCEKCGMPRSECVCVINIVVEKPKIQSEAIKQLKEARLKLGQSMWDDIEKEWNESDMINTTQDNIFTWLKENYRPPLKIK